MKKTNYKYNISVGIRIPFLSKYKNIIEIK